MMSGTAPIGSYVDAVMGSAAPAHNSPHRRREAEANLHTGVVLLAVLAARRPAVLWFVAPAAATEHAEHVALGRRSFRIDYRAVRVGGKHVRTPLHRVAVHILQAKGILLKESDRRSK